MGDLKTILVVDDEPNVVTYLQTLFEDNGYKVVTAVDGQDGLTKAQSEKPDLITLDISMPIHVYSLQCVSTVTLSLTNPQQGSIALTRLEHIRGGRNRWDG